MAGQANTTRYKDLDLDFIAHPVTGDVVQKINKEAVKQAVRNLVYMKPYDKPFQPHINSRINGLLFEPSSRLVSVDIRKAISDILSRHEPRIYLIGIDAINNVRQDSYDITITYQILNQPEIDKVSFSLERLR